MTVRDIGNLIEKAWEINDTNQSGVEKDVTGELAKALSTIITSAKNGTNAVIKSDDSNTEQSLDKATPFEKRAEEKKKGEYVGFDKMKEKLSHQKGVTDAGGLAAYIGRKKYGKKGFAQLANKAMDVMEFDDEDISKAMADYAKENEYQNKKLDSSTEEKDEAGNQDPNKEKVEEKSSKDFASSNNGILTEEDEEDSDKPEDEKDKSQEGKEDEEEDNEDYEDEDDEDYQDDGEESDDEDYQDDGEEPEDEEYQEEEVVEDHAQPMHPDTVNKDIPGFQTPQPTLMYSEQDEPTPEATEPPEIKLDLKDKKVEYMNDDGGEICVEGDCPEYIELKDKIYSAIHSAIEKIVGSEAQTMPIQDCMNTNKPPMEFEHSNRFM
jgi:hypothetical protein